MELLYAREYTQGERAWERGYALAMRNDGIRGYCLLCFTLAVNTCKFSVAVPQHRDAGQLTLVPAWCLFKCVWLLSRFNVASTYNDVTYATSMYNDIHLRRTLTLIARAKIYQAHPPLFSDGSKVIHGIIVKKEGEPGDKASTVSARLLKASHNQRG